jgi:hypothetical protein
MIDSIEKQDFYLSQERIGEIWEVRTDQYKRINSRRPETSTSIHLMPLKFDEIKNWNGPIPHKVLVCLCLETGEIITRNPEYCFNNKIYSMNKATEQWFNIA